MKKFRVLLLMISIINVNYAQLSSIQQWETAIFADQAWKYILGDQVTDTSWRNPLFNDSGWQVGIGGFGYGDGDDNTLIPPTKSLYLRKEFQIIDTSVIEAAVLHADYDDGFVAYLNNVEIARANLGFVGDRPGYDESTHIYGEPLQIQGQKPTSFFIDKKILQLVLKPGSNLLAIQVHNYGNFSSDMTGIFYLSLGISDSISQYSAPPGWFYPPLTISELPILHIKTFGPPIPDEPRLVGDLGVINHALGQIHLRDEDFNEYHGPIAIEIRGSSSQLFPKKGYGLETQDSLGENNNVSLLGMPSENDWILYGPYSDKSLIRNKLTFELGRRTGQYVPRSQFCELIINEEDRGVYLLMEKIKEDKGRLDIATITPDDTIGDELTGGYIIKVDRGTGNPEDEFLSSYPPHPMYVLHDPDGLNLKPVQREYIRNYIEDFEDAAWSVNFADTAAGYRKYIDVPSFIDYLLINELAKDVDAYRLSAFFYKDKDSKGGKLKAGPLWDYNLTFGNYDYCLPQPEGWAYNFNMDCGGQVPFYWPKLMTDPQFQNETQCRWNELRQGPLHTDSIMEWIDSTTIALQPAQERHFNRWPILGNYVWPNNFIGQTHEEEINYLKNWLTTRLNWIDQNLPGTCEITHIDQLDKKNPVNAFPNPFSSVVEVEVKATSNEPLEMKIYNSLGQLIAQLHPDKWNPNAQTFTWDSRKYPRLGSGAYFFRIENSEGRILGTTKLIKSNP